jgi:hypothetical protein
MSAMAVSGQCHVEMADLRFMPRRFITSSADNRLAAARVGSDPLGRKVDQRR